MAASSRSASTKTRTAKNEVKDSPVKNKASASKPKPSRAKEAPAPKIVEQIFRRFTKDTPGTFRFEAIDPKTKLPVKSGAKNAHITQLYVSRSSSALSSDPKFLRVTIEEVSALPKGAAVEADNDDDSEDEEEA